MDALAHGIDQRPIPIGGSTLKSDVGDSALADIDVGRAPEYFDLCSTGRPACDRL